MTLYSLGTADVRENMVGVCAYIDNNLYVIYVDERRAFFIHAIDMRMSVMCIQPCTSLL